MGSARKKNHIAQNPDSSNLQGFVLFAWSILLNISINLLYSNELSSTREIIPLLIVWSISFGRTLFWSCLFWTICSFIKNIKLKSLFSLGTGLALFLLFIIEFILVKQQGSLYTLTIASIFASSNIKESKEFLSSTMTYKDFIPPVLLGSGLLVITTLVYRKGVCKLNVGRKMRCTAKIFMLITLITGGIMQYNMFRSSHRGKVTTITMSNLDRFIWSSYSVYAESKSIAKYVDRLKNKTFDVSPSRLSIPHNIVLILGESLRRDYMHCYGYELNNTPNIDRMHASGNMILFDQANSPASSTVLSLLHVLSMKLTTDSNQWYEYPFINDIMRRAGYTTTWLSNQESSGFFVQILNSVAGLSDKVWYTKTLSADEDIHGLSSTLDEKITELIDELTITRDSKKSYFDILHLMGSHYTYTSRFPEEYARFTSKDIKQDLDYNSKTIVASYVNTVLYNDFVISEIIKRYESSPSIIIYLSDHGEVLFDDPKRPSYIGHGGEVVPQGINIPLMIYLSPEMQKAYPDLKQKILLAKNRRIMTDIIPHSICALLGITTPWNSKDLDFFSEFYNNNREHVVVQNSELRTVVEQ